MTRSNPISFWSATCRLCSSDISSSSWIKRPKAMSLKATLAPLPTLPAFGPPTTASVPPDSVTVFTSKVSGLFAGVSFGSWKPKSPVWIV